MICILIVQNIKIIFIISSDGTVYSNSSNPSEDYIIGKNILDFAGKSILDYLGSES